MKMDDVIYCRRSIRKYLDKQVPKEKIEQIIDAGRMSPSAKNRQPWQYIVLGGQSKSELIALGYAAETPAQRPRKKMEDIVEYRL